MVEAKGKRVNAGGVFVGARKSGELLFLESFPVWKSLGGPRSTARSKSQNTNGSTNRTGEDARVYIGE